MVTSSMICNSKIGRCCSYSMMSNIARRKNICHQPEIIFLVNSVVGKGKWGLIYMYTTIYIHKYMKMMLAQNMIL
jgi:hypothetical protein